MKKIIVSGLVNVEHSLNVDHFPIEYCPIEYPFFGVNSTISGVGYNIYKALAVLGSKVNLYSLIGDDNNGKLVQVTLKSEKISNSNIKVVEEEQTPESIVIFDKNGKRKIYCDLKNIQNLSINPDDIDYENYSLAILTNINFNRPLLPAFKRKGIKIATDVHALSDINDEYNRDFLAFSDILFLSNEGCNGNEIFFIKNIYNKYNNEIIVMGCGEKGAIAYSGKTDSLYSVSAVAPLGINNTVGAGDALFSAFIHFYHKGAHLEECLKAAVTFAGIKISASGGSNGFVDEETLKKYL